MLSQIGYVLVYHGCPISWTSKLQMEIALSTTEAKYQALRTCMQHLLPMQTLIQELSTHGFINDMTISSTHIFSAQLKTDIFEDNQSCHVITFTFVCL